MKVWSPSSVWIRSDQSLSEHQSVEPSRTQYLQPGSVYLPALTHLSSAWLLLTQQQPAELTFDPGHKINEFCLEDDQLWLLLTTGGAAEVHAGSSAAMLFINQQDFYDHNQ